MGASLSLRIRLGVGLLTVLGLVVFGLVLTGVSEATLRQSVDRDLLNRARPISRGMRQGPPDNGRPPQREGEFFEGGRGPGQRGPRDPNPLQRPRVYDRSGGQTGPDEPAEIWSRTMFDASLRGEEVLGWVQWEGRALRVASLPTFGRDPGAISGVVQVAQDWEPYRASLNAQRNSFVWILPIAVLLIAALGWVLSKFILNPVRSLTEAAERLAADPDREEVIPVQGQDEIGRLAAAFNAMTGSLQQVNREVEAALERQTRFTSDAAHELRTPLTSLRLAAENGLHPEATAEEMRQSLAAVDRSSEAMAKLTSLLLTLARVDHGQARLELERVPVLPMVLEVVSGVDGVVADVPEDMVLNVNPGAFKQVVQNLVENARAHTPDGGEIRVLGRGNRLEVSDTGIGIAAEHLPHLFDRFYRVDPSRNRASGGFGLGLAIVKSLVLLQDGEIRVESEVGRGTTFFITFGKSQDSSQDPHN